jgi:hypothetical protein
VGVLQFSLLLEVYWRYDGDEVHGGFDRNWRQRSPRVGTVAGRGGWVSGGQSGSDGGRSGEKVGVDRNMFHDKVSAAMCGIHCESSSCQRAVTDTPHVKSWQLPQRVRTALVRVWVFLLSISDLFLLTILCCQLDAP